MSGLLGSGPEGPGLLGRIGSLFDVSDPERMNQLALSLRLLQARRGDDMGKMFWQAATNHAGIRQQKLEEERARFDMDQRRQAANRQQQIDALGPKYLRPGAAPSLTTHDDEGNPMPSTQPSMDWQGYTQALTGLDPQRGLTMQAQLAQLGQKERVKVGAGETIGSYQGGRFVPDFTAPEKAPAGFVRNQRGGLEIDPAWFDAQLKLRKAGATNVSVDNRLENREHQDKGALNVKNFSELQSAAGTARKENALLSFLEKNPIDTSRAAPITTTAAAWLSAAGLGGERAKEIAKNAQMFNAAAMELVLQKQLAQKGPQTESDARRLEQTVASLGNTKEANAAIMAFSRAANNRLLAQEKFYNEWWKRNRTFEGADAAWINGQGSRSVWEEPSLARYAEAAPQGSSTGRVIDFNDLPSHGR